MKKLMIDNKMMKLLMYEIESFTPPFCEEEDVIRNGCNVIWRKKEESKGMVKWHLSIYKGKKHISKIIMVDISIIDCKERYIKRDDGKY